MPTAGQDGGMQLRQRDLTWQTVGEDLVVLDLHGSVYLRLAGSGRLLWERLTSPASDAELAAVLVDAYGIDAERAKVDVAEFVDDLRRRQLVVD